MKHSGLKGKLIEQDDLIFYLSRKYFHKLDEDFIQSMRLVVFQHMNKHKFDMKYIYKPLKEQAWLYFVNNFLTDKYRMNSIDIKNAYGQGIELKKSYDMELDKISCVDKYSIIDMKNSVEDFKLLYDNVLHGVTQKELAQERGCTERNVRYKMNKIKSELRR